MFLFLTGITKEDVAEVLDKQLAPLSAAVMTIIAEVIDPWENIRTDTSSVNDVEAPTAANLREFYNVQPQHCMILGSYPQTGRAANIQRAHIWPKHTFGRGLDVFGLERESLCSCQNYLLLQAEVEYYFDRKKIILVPTFSGDGSIHFRLYVLYTAMLTAELKIQTHNKSGSQLIPWSDLHTKPIAHIFHNDGPAPFMRLIAQHTFASLKKAQRSAEAIVFSDADHSSFRDGAIALARRSLHGEDRDQTIRNVLKYNGFN